MTDAWSLEALIARLELHPAFKEVYVEGESDIAFYQLFLEDGGCGDVLVYPVSSVSIPQEVRDSLFLPDMDRGSRRTDVILLALALQLDIPSASDRVTCIADADCQHIQPIAFASSFLKFTDYASVELYAYKADFITKLIRIGSPNSKTQGREVLSELTLPLEVMFSFRIASHQLGLGLKWIDPDKELSYLKGRVIFDGDRFAGKYLNNNGRMASQKEFWQKVREIRNAFVDDSRMQIRGHDFMELLSWYLRKHTYRAFHKFSSDIVRHNLLSQLRFADLASEGLFISLLTRYAA